MTLKIRQIFPRLLLLGGLLLSFCFAPAYWTCPPAFAVLREYQAAPGIMRYQSQHSLKDTSGYAWQVVLFQQFSPQAAQTLILRLVGFPNVAKFVHPLPLEITTNSGKLLTANDLLSEQFLAPNVGQYNVTDLIAQLPKNKSVKLSVPLAENKNLSLTIPSSVVIEWQWLATEL